MTAMWWDPACACYREGKAVLQDQAVQAYLDGLDKVAAYFPHYARHGPTRVEPEQGDGPWQAVCACGYRGPLRDAADRDARAHAYDDARQHEDEANAHERGESNQ